MKIVYCTDTICYRGGIQSITISKANALAEIEGNEVWILVTDVAGDTVRPLSPKVHVIDLQVRYYEYDWKSKWHVLKSIVLKRKQHRKKLDKILNEILPNIVVSTGTSEKYILPTLKVTSKPKFIREIHFFTNYRRAAANGLFETVMAVLGDYWDYGIMIQRYDKIVVLTNEDKETNWKNDDKVVVIPNLNTLSTEKYSKQTEKTVISVGRLTSQKNFSSLINIWRLVSEKHPDWNLVIYGDGALRSELDNLISKYELSEKVKLMGYAPDISSRYAEASLYVMSSLFEGFGLVIIEAMSCGLPVVSYACPCGPKDIIEDGKDGFLLRIGDEEGMAGKVCQLIENEDLRRNMSEAAKTKANHYNISSVIDQWMTLFNEILKTNI